MGGVNREATDIGGIVETGIMGMGDRGANFAGNATLAARESTAVGKEVELRAGDLDTRMAPMVSGGRKKG